jgi:hypothetical protein
MASHTKDPARAESHGASEFDHACGLIYSEYTASLIETQIAALMRQAGLTKPAAHTVAELAWGRA